MYSGEKAAFSAAFFSRLQPLYDTDNDGLNPATGRINWLKIIVFRHQSRGFGVPEESFHCGLFLVQKGDDDLAVVSCLGLPADNIITVIEPRVDHAAAAYLQDENILLGAEKIRKRKRGLFLNSVDPIPR